MNDYRPPKPDPRHRKCEWCGEQGAVAVEGRGRGNLGNGMFIIACDVHRDLAYKSVERKARA